MKEKKIVVISLGGSVIIPEKGIDIKSLEDFKKTLRKFYKKYKFIVVCGGGSIARKYISVLREEGKVGRVRVDLKYETVEVETESDKSSEELAQILTEKIKQNGYTLSVEKTEKENGNGTGRDSGSEVYYFGRGGLGARR